MFDLDQAVTAWRAKLLAAGLTDPAVLDELEAHLREDFAREVKSGLEASPAFVAAVETIGSGSALKVEFEKDDEINPVLRSLIKLFYYATVLSALWEGSAMFHYVWEINIHGVDYPVQWPSSDVPGAILLCLFFTTFLAVRRYIHLERKQLPGLFVCLILVLLRGGALIVGSAFTVIAGLSVYAEYFDYGFNNGHVKTLISLLVWTGSWLIFYFSGKALRADFTRARLRTSDQPRHV